MATLKKPHRKRKTHLSMRTLLLILILQTSAPAPVTEGTCNPYGICTACKDCSKCKHCSQRGGHCSVCKPKM